MSKTKGASSDDGSAIEPKIALPQPSKHELPETSITCKRCSKWRLSDEVPEAHACNLAGQQTSRPLLGQTAQHREESLGGSISDQRDGRGQSISEGHKLRSEGPAANGLKNTGLQKDEESQQHGLLGAVDVDPVARSTSDVATAHAASRKATSAQMPGAIDASIAGTSCRAQNAPEAKSTLVLVSRAAAGKRPLHTNRARAVPLDLKSRQHHTAQQALPAVQFSGTGSSHVQPKQITAGGIGFLGGRLKQSQNAKQHSESSSGRGMARRVRQRLSGDEDELFQTPSCQDLVEPMSSANKAAEEQHKQPQTEKTATPAWIEAAGQDPTLQELESRVAKGVENAEVQLLIARAEELRLEMHQVLQLHGQLRLEKAAAEAKDRQDAGCSPLQSSESSQAIFPSMLELMTSLIFTNAKAFLAPYFPYGIRAQGSPASHSANINTFQERKSP